MQGGADTAHEKLSEQRDCQLALYIAGGLSPEEMKAFEARLETDEALNKEYQFFAQGMESLKAKVLLDEVENNPDLPRIDAEVKAFLAERDRDQTPARKFRKALLRVMSAAILIAAFLVIRSFWGTDTEVRLYEKYYEPLSGEALGALVVRGSSDASLDAGIACYTEEDYSCALEQLKDIQEGAFFLGLSYLALERYEEAVVFFLVFQRAYPEYPGVNWYLGLTYLRLDRPDEALDSFGRLFTMSNPYSDRAEKLIRKIEKMKAAS